MMLAPALRLALAAALAGTLGLRSAHADIYTWVDANGSINVSNLQPPDDARVIKVTHESAPPAARDDGAGDAASRQALADRVRQLEREVELARRPVPPPADYAPAPAYAPMPPAPSVQYNVQYIVQAPPAPEQYQYAASDYPPANNNGCDSTWGNCGFGWSPGFYPPGFVVLQQPNFRRIRPSPRGRPFVPHAAPILPPLIGPIQPLSTPIVSPLAMPRSPTASFRKG